MGGGLGPEMKRENQGRRDRAMQAKGLTTLWLALGMVMGSPADTRARAHVDEVETSPTPIFDYERAPIPFKNRLLDEEETSLYRVRYVRFPSIGDNGQTDNLVRGKYYESKLPGPKPLVIVLPIWSRHVYPPEKMTAHFTKRSSGRVNVFLMQGDFDLIEWKAFAAAADETEYLKIFEQGAQREWVTITDIRRTIDWAEQRDETDPGRVGLLGFSHGAIVASAAAVQEPRLAATVLVMGSALAHQVIAQCPLERSVVAREKASSDFGWSRDELQERLEPIFLPLDPASYPGRVDPSRVLIVEAKRDECMPANGRLALWEAMGRPERLQLNFGHKQAFLAMTPVGLNWLRHKIWRFFSQTLEVE